MKHIEDYLKKSWEKIPYKFKNRISYGISAGVNVDNVGYGIWFDEIQINKEIQKVIDRIVVNALSRFYGFTEDEAHELLKQISL